MVIMFKKILQNDIYKKHRELILMAIDLFIVFLSYVLALWTKNNFSLVFDAQVEETFLLAVMGIVFIVYAFCFIVFKVYKSLWKYIGVDELMRLTLSNAIATILLMVFMAYFLKNSFYVSVDFIAGILALVLMAGIRVVYRLLRRLETAENAIAGQRIVIIGAGDAGNLLLKEIKQNKLLGYKIVGFVDDAKQDIMIGGYKVLGSTNDLKLI